MPCRICGKNVEIISDKHESNELYPDVDFNYIHEYCKNCKITWNTVGTKRIK